MRTLTKLSFENFQSLKNTSIDIDPGFNVLVGPSDLGKSASIRALRALIYNAPAPGLVRQGARDFQISAQIDDGTTEILNKGKNISQYTIVPSDGGDERVFAKAGAHGVPEEISELWRLGNADSRNLTFAAQHDPPFLIAEPASAVAKVLGDLTNASMLTEAVSKANKIRVAALADEKARTREAEETKAEILTHAGLKKRSELVVQARKLYERAKGAEDRLNALRALQRDYEETVEALAQARKLTHSLSDPVAAYDKALSALTRLDFLENLSDEYTRTIKLIEQTQLETAGFDESIEELEQQIHELMGDSCPLCNQEIVK